VNKSATAATAIVRDMEVHIEGVVDPEKERAKLQKQKEQLLQKIAASEKKLTNEGFLAKAGEAVVAKERAQLEDGHPGAQKIWESMGVYLGYGIAHYADFYDIRHVLILGRCTSGCGGDLLIKGAKDVFAAEFPELLQEIELHLPDEKIRRVGQSVAAASLPVIA
jgi:predicted NBD/HSP70 family sugar kinase